MQVAPVARGFSLFGTTSEYSNPEVKALNTASGSFPQDMYTRTSGVKKAKIVVEKKKFDAVLSQLLRTPPMPMKQIKTSGKRRSGQLIQKRSES
jgi:hypothetical protein